MSRLPPPIADKQVSEHHGDCIWNCLNPEQQKFLRSFCPRSWRPPEKRFARYNYNMKFLYESEADFEREKELNRTMTALPKTSWKEAE